MQAFEGYYEDGGFYAFKPPLNIPNKRRVIITVLDEPMCDKPDTWSELDKITAGMSDSEKPRVEDFPRLESEREPIDFDEV
jgi:hypothetical protein